MIGERGEANRHERDKQEDEHLKNMLIMFEFIVYRMNLIYFDPLVSKVNVIEKVSSQIIRL